MAACSAVIGGLFGLALGWTGALVYLVPLVPIGVVLLVIDWRTTLLPTRIIHPTYVLLAVLIPLAALLDRDLDSLYRAGFGWLVVGGWFWIFWWLLNAWGFGDVRLARVLGPALGYLGWAHMLMGLALMVLLGGIGGGARVANRSLRGGSPTGRSCWSARPRQSSSDPGSPQVSGTEPASGPPYLADRAVSVDVRRRAGNSPAPGSSNCPSVRLRTENCPLGAPAHGEVPGRRH